MESSGYSMFLESKLLPPFVGEKEDISNIFWENHCPSSSETKNPCQGEKEIRLSSADSIISPTIQGLDTEFLHPSPPNLKNYYSLKRPFSSDSIDDIIISSSRPEKKLRIMDAAYSEKNSQNSLQYTDPQTLGPGPSTEMDIFTLEHKDDDPDPLFLKMDLELNGTHKLLVNPPAFENDIQRVLSPGGIERTLVDALEFRESEISKVVDMKVCNIILPRNNGICQENPYEHEIFNEQVDFFDLGDAAGDLSPENVFYKEGQGHSSMDKVSSVLQVIRDMPDEENIEESCSYGENVTDINLPYPNDSAITYGNEIWFAKAPILQDEIDQNKQRDVRNLCSPFCDDEMVKITESIAADAHASENVINDPIEGSTSSLVLRDFICYPCGDKDKIGNENQTQDFQVSPFPTQGFSIALTVPPSNSGLPLNVNGKIENGTESNVGINVDATPNMLTHPLNSQAICFNQNTTAPKLSSQQTSQKWEYGIKTCFNLVRNIFRKNGMSKMKENNLIEELVQEIARRRGINRAGMTGADTKKVRRRFYDVMNIMVGSCNLTRERLGNETTNTLSWIGEPGFLQLLQQLKIERHTSEIEEIEIQDLQHRVDETKFLLKVARVKTKRTIGTENVKNWNYQFEP